MKQNENKGSFTYKYSASEQSEIKRIRDKYATDKGAPEESKLDRLRRLDEGVTKRGTVFALVIGIISTLILGFGMSLFMTGLGGFIGNDAVAMLIGIIMGLIGIVGVALAYPIYNLVTKRERERVAPEILKLSDELMK